MNLSVLKNDGVITPEEYIEGEKVSEIKHEYVNGWVYAMAGASEEHNLIVQNLSGTFWLHLRNSQCRAYVADMKTQVKTQQDERFYYPDLQISCDQNDRERYFKQHPKLIVEVLSKSTYRSDRDEKFNAYRNIKALNEYVLVHQDHVMVEIFRKRTQWQREIFSANDQLVFESIDLDVSIEQIYEKVF